jgi:hypothetical protein
VENWVLIKIFGPHIQEGLGDRRKLHNEQLHDMYCLVNVIRVIRASKMRLVGHVARTEEKWNENTIFVGKPGGKRPLGRSFLKMEG